MKPGFASLLIAVLLFGVSPALAAAPATAAAGAPAATPAAAPPASPEPGADSGDADTMAPAEAPVPDPFIAEILKTCRDGASGDKSTLQRLQDAGWGLTVDGDTQTPFYQSFSGSKDYDGVGTVNITFSLEVYPTLTEGYCSASIDTAERKVGIADISKMADLKGKIETTADGVASTWQEAGATATSFIQVDQHIKDLYFILDVTTLIRKPAEDIPYVKPDTTDDPGGDDPDMNGAGATNING